MPDYEMDVKGEAFLEGFVDPGPAFDPAAGPDDAFHRAVVENASEIVLSFGHDGTIAYANDAVRVLLGHDPRALIGTNVLHLVAPDDLANAAETMYHAAEVVGWRPPRPFRLVHADGHLTTYEVAGLSLFDDPRVRGIVTIARWAETSSRVDRVIGLLASQRPIEEVLAELVHLLDRPGWQLAVALQYGDGEGGLRATTSHRDERLTGADPASIGSGPWADARRTNGPVADVGLHTLAPPARAAAQAAGFVTCWAVPVRDPLGEPAVLVVWSGEPREPELGQDLVLQRLLSLVELALDGRARSTELHRAANCDPLTGLWNRRYLEQAAAEASTARRPGSVAVVLCDLDGFKAVNDGFGHPAGDHVIQVVAARLRNAVRAGDVVSRIGGDEFAILCTGVDDAFDVEVVAQRILAAIDQPIPSDVGVLRVGVSVGIAVDDDDAWDLDQLIRRADARLLEAKAAGKATYRISVGARG